MTTAFELTIVYEPAEAGHVTGRVPSVPGAISFGASQDEARDNLLGALGEMLAVELPSAPHGATAERLGLMFSMTRTQRRDLDLERSDAGRVSVDPDRAHDGVARRPAAVAVVVDLNPDSAGDTVGAPTRSDVSLRQFPPKLVALIR
jgi:predicted RNase H-like HicB family nuclease